MSGGRGGATIKIHNGKPSTVKPMDIGHNLIVVSMPNK